MFALDAFRRIDGGLAAALLFLLGVSLASLLGISIRDGSYALFYRQVAWIVLGLAIFVALANIDYRMLRGARWFILGLYLAGALALVGLLVAGTNIRGVTSWFRLGSFNVGPVEFAKIILIIVLAQYFSLRHIESYRVMHIFISAVYTLLYAALVFKQPDMGSVMILLGTWFGIVLISGMRLKQFVALLAIFAMLFTVAWFFLFAEYQQ
ncbi:MAG: FtsW/RodA/SpoVE family cell cycle protein, partial [bacterium]|nr:FtsW/RodA/SpoVE family cell cycle protein [bacterium]